MTTSSPSRRPSGPIRPPASVYLAAFVEQVDEHLLKRRGSASVAGPRVRARRSARASAPRSADGRPRRRWRRPARGRGPCGRPILPRVIRETSRRSSIRRARCPTCRWMTSLAHPRSSRLRASRRAGRRCRSTPAGSSARGRASRGIRPCGGRLRARSASIRFCSVMSRPVFDAPTISPSASRIGETVSDTSMIVPSLRRRFVW